MNQSRITSLRESVTNTAIGFALSLAAQWAFLPLIGVPIELWQNVVFAVFMTAVSIARGYVIRRWFEAKRASFPVTPALLAVVAERQRQIGVEGWTLEHDDHHSDGELALAAAAYLYSGSKNWPQRAAAHAVCADNLGGPSIDELQVIGLLWPWSWDWWKPKIDDRRRDYVRGLALGLAELERFDRNRKRERS